MHFVDGGWEVNQALTVTSLGQADNGTNGFSVAGATPLPSGAVDGTYMPTVHTCNTLPVFQKQKNLCAGVSCTFVEEKKKNMSGSELGLN